MKPTALILIAFIFAMCKTPKVEFKEYHSWMDASMIENYLMKLNASDDRYSLLIFTNGFNGELIEIINGDEIVFHNVLNSIQNLGFAKEFRIDNTKLTTVKELKRKYSFKIKSEIAIKYKYIYVHRNISNGKYTITFSHNLKNFL